MHCDDLQRITIGFLIIFCIFSLFCYCPVIIWLLYAGNIYVKSICILYLAFYIYDFNVANHGGRIANQSLRNWGLWKWCLNYFPVDLVKTTDLSPDRNYLICIFSHGYFRPRLTTLAMNFYNPIFREVYLSLGMSSVSAKSLIAMLKQSNDFRDKLNRDGYTSNAAGLIVGGEREQRYSDRDTYKFVLKNRKGFVRIALKTGASLVPAISFGENNTFEMKRWRFRFNGRVPITTVIGAPIHLKENLSPNEDDVNEVHQHFCDQIKELFEAQKSKYIESFDKVQLEFV